MVGQARVTSIVSRFVMKVHIWLCVLHGLDVRLSWWLSHLLYAVMLFMECVSMASLFSCKQVACAI